MRNPKTRGVGSEGLDATPPPFGSCCSDKRTQDKKTKGNMIKHNKKRREEKREEQTFVEISEGVAREEGMVWKLLKCVSS